MDEHEPPAPAPDSRTAPGWTWSLWTMLGGWVGMTVPVLPLVMARSLAAGESFPDLLVASGLLYAAVPFGWFPGGFGAARVLALRDRRGETWPLWAVELGGALLAGAATTTAALSAIALFDWIVGANAG